MDETFQAIIGVILCCFVVMFFVVPVTMICIKKRAKRSRTQAAQDPGTHQTAIAVEERASFNPSLEITSMTDIVAATKNFSNDMLAYDSGFGLFYKAELPNGLKLAVKKLDSHTLQSFTEFRSELEILGKLRHRNVARLLGYCISGTNRVLIYEFFEMGNLYTCLHDLDFLRFRFLLSWEIRHVIIRGVANGLAYMHGLEKPIIHRDIKPTNIFLDSKFEAHITTFGLARTVKEQDTHVSTQAAGTAGYMPPEYKEGSNVATVRGDVYSFGILMLEVATGKQPALTVVVEGKEMGFIEWATAMVAQNREREMLDPSLWVDGTSRKELDRSDIQEYFRIAFMCANPLSRDRPTMSDVVELLVRNSM